MKTQSTLNRIFSFSPNSTEKTSYTSIRQKTAFNRPVKLYLITKNLLFSGKKTRV